VTVKLVQLHPEAQAELKEAVSFYRSRGGETLARKFKSRVKEVFTNIASNPNRYPGIPEIQEVQKCRLSQFPYSILYLNQPDCIWIIAVAHGSRCPGYWMERVSL
jgi:plasmid stabilization system protein ParE